MPQDNRFWIADTFTVGDPIEQKEKEGQMSIDYIIIGAGSAGCALANRLSKNPKNSVLLLEAGGPDKKQEVGIPAAFAKMFKTEVDWAYETAPQENLNGRKLFWPRGKMLGGCSSINAMIYQRGHRSDYQKWAELGNEEWGYNDVLPYFKKMENQERGADAYHGTGGPLNVADLREPNILSKAFVAASQQAGFFHNKDFNGAKQEGFGQYQVTQCKGKRESAATAYLKPIMKKRSNLQIETEALATKLQFDGTRCTGVTYEQNGTTHTAIANKEVIVSGGAVNSPQLLLLSGIGDNAHLQEMGIPVVVDLPGVGQNLIDHMLIILAYKCKQPVTLASAESIVNIAKFLLLGKGMLSSNIGEAGGFTKILGNSTAPDLQFHFAPAYFLEHGFKTPEGHGFSIGPTLVGTRSIGYLKLQSADPHTHPIIQPNYLSNDEDMGILVEGVKIARKIAHSPAFAPYLDSEHTPGEKVQSDDEIRDFIRREVETLYHPVGTCKMGQDPMAVVNSRLQVHGLTGLRVADASIMPTIINANTNVPSIMIGEKCADMILNG